jgi:hypothetical protein
MEDDITVGVQLLLEDGVSNALAAIMTQLAAADQAIDATSANWDGLDSSNHVPLSPVPISPETPFTRSPDTAAPDFDLPDLRNSVREPQDFAAPVTVPMPFVPLDALAQPKEALPASYAARIPDISAPGEAWTDSVPKPSELGVDPAPMPNIFPSAAFDGDYWRPALAPDAGQPPLKLPILPAAPIPTKDRPTAPRAPSDPGWQTQPLSVFAPMFPPRADSVAPRETEPTAATPSASDLIPSRGNASEATATAPLADAGGGEGQLMLDGSLLGRWVIDHLSREADRPPSGGTAFDPRQGH